MRRAPLSSSTNQFKVNQEKQNRTFIAFHLVLNLNPSASPFTSILLLLLLLLFCFVLTFILIFFLSTSVLFHTRLRGTLIRDSPIFKRSSAGSRLYLESVQARTFQKEIGLERNDQRIKLNDAWVSGWFTFKHFRTKGSVFYSPNVGM